MIPGGRVLISVMVPGANAEGIELASASEATIPLKLIGVLGGPVPTLNVMVAIMPSPITLLLVPIAATMSRFPEMLRVFDAAMPAAPITALAMLTRGAMKSTFH